MKSGCCLAVSVTKQARAIIPNHLGSGTSAAIRVHCSCSLLPPRGCSPWEAGAEEAGRAQTLMLLVGDLTDSYGTVGKHKQTGTRKDVT